MENWKWISLVWVSKPVVLHIEEEAMSLSQFQPIFVLFVTISAVLDPCQKAMSPVGITLTGSIINLPWWLCRSGKYLFFFLKIQALIHCVSDLQIILGKGNASLENETVKHLNIQPDHKVLEIGFGPGIGLNAALERVEHSSGKVYGIDISEQIVSTEFKGITVYWGGTGEKRGGFRRDLGTRLGYPPLHLLFWHKDMHIIKY